MGEEEQLLVFDSSGWTIDMRIHSCNSELSCWTVNKLPSIWNDRCDFGLVLISSTMIFAGGFIDGSDISEVLCLNLQTMKFSENSPMLQARRKFALVELNDELYAVGGLVNEEWSISVEKYNFSIGKWHVVSPLMSMMKFVTVAVLDGCLYAIGQYFPCMECYDPASNRWSRKAAPNSRSQHINIIGFAGFLYAIGKGYNNGICCITFERYDPSNNIWETKQSPRYGEKCAVLKNRLLTCGIMDLNKKEYVIEEYKQEDNEWNTLTNISPVKDVYAMFTLKK